MRPSPPLIPRFLPARLPIPASRPAESMSAPHPYPYVYANTYANTARTDVQAIDTATGKQAVEFAFDEWFPKHRAVRKGYREGYGHDQGQAWNGYEAHAQSRREGRMKVEGMQGRVAGQRGMDHTLNRYHSTSAIPLHHLHCIQPSPSGPSAKVAKGKGKSKGWGVSPHSDKPSASAARAAESQLSASARIHFRSTAQAQAPAETEAHRAAAPTIYYTADGRASTVPPPTIAWCDHLSMI